MKHYLSIISLLLIITVSCSKRKITTESPSEKLAMNVLNTEKGLRLELLNQGSPALEIDAGGFIFKNGKQWNNYIISEVKKTRVNEQWRPVYGEKNLIPNRYNEVKIALTGKQNSSQKLTLLCRLYDEGLAFKYVFDSVSAGNMAVKEELTRFNFVADYPAWITNHAQGIIQKIKLSQIKKACERPLVVQQNDSTYFALGEAALVDFARMKFIKNPEKAFSLQSALAGEVDLAKAGYETPWRYVMVADSPGELLENNYLVLNLNQPSQLKDVSWIKPGKVIREVTLTTKGGMACVDFAARHNLEYVEFDAGWYGPENDINSDATTVTVDPRRSPGPLELQKVIDYANQKGVGIILYVNHKALEQQLNEILPLCKSWGVKGLKYGFVNVGAQEWTSWLHAAVRKAADYELMVDIHDEYRPTGYSRTYPNLMTQEGIRGDEATPSIEHSLLTLFTRYLAGAADNTNCYFAERVPEKMGGKCGQMAKAIMLYSPWQFIYWYDRPEASPRKKGGAGSSERIIKESADLAFFDALPTVWDDTKVLEGEIGEYATIARKSGQSWFIGSLTANQARKVEIPLSFLDNKNYEAEIFFQDKEDLKNNEVKSEKIMVTQKSIIARNLEQNSGLAIIVRAID